jgi:asparagine synthase (glutamine-hydrolysing)
VLSGEGADEILEDLYFRNAPSAEEFQKRNNTKLFTADLLRADKSTMSQGLETRVPFLDKDFLDVVMRINPEEKQPKTYDNKEKYILRKAFETSENPYLPADILWSKRNNLAME